MASCPVNEATNTATSVPQTVPQLMEVPSSPGGGLNRQPPREWMVVAPRQHRPPRNGLNPPRKEAVPGKETPPVKGVNGGNNSGFRFDVLMDYQTVARLTPLVKEPILGRDMEAAIRGNKFNALMGTSTNMGTLGKSNPSTPEASPAPSMAPSSILGGSHTVLEREAGPTQPGVSLGGRTSMEISSSTYPLPRSQH
ncbi:hypothetical protein Tsubulata_016177 [Turnera subulata]|uniref:Uncharacterized protein n=1 Tax=Turnera subulata TaxID=218843 RepID=A0A9Q0GEA1_9ROSI|nr:hypothetical protein Tsubulata_016177 [Turnera subulata]